MNRLGFLILSILKQNEAVKGKRCERYELCQHPGDENRKRETLSD